MKLTTAPMERNLFTFSEITGSWISGKSLGSKAISPSELISSRSLECSKLLSESDIGLSAIGNTKKTGELGLKPSNFHKVEPMADNKSVPALNVLSKGSIQKICSAQVILDLATAVKELIENGLDAGATQVGMWRALLKTLGIFIHFTLPRNPNQRPWNWIGRSHRQWIWDRRRRLPKNQ